MRVGIGVVMLAFIAAIAAYSLLAFDNRGPHVQLAGETVRVAVADTPELRAQGLSGHAGLTDDEGMLFVFQEDGMHSFWMKDMRFAIDIVWISADGTVVHIVKNVSPDTYPEAFAPPSPARYVLELPAGWCVKNGLEIGDMVDLGV